MFCIYSSLSLKQTERTLQKQFIQNLNKNNKEIQIEINSASVIGPIFFSKCVCHF